MYSVNDFRNTFSGWKTGIMGAGGHFSVLVPLVDVEGQAHILYEVRSECIDRQPKEVCFPGGELEPGESPKEAAIRETFEEIGIEGEDIDIIAELDTYHPESGIVIYPFLAEIKKETLKKIKTAPAEVGEVFLVPVSFFENEPYRYIHELKTDLGDDFDPSKIGLKDKNYSWHPVRSEIISWQFEGKFIWGLTARITDAMMKIIRNRN